MTVRWDVDDRAPSAYARLYMRAMWLMRDKHAFEGAQHTLVEARRRQRSGDRPPTRLTRTLTQVSTGDVAGMTVWSVRPRGPRPAARVLYVHGGGYVHPLTADYWRLVRSLTTVPAEVLVPAYPLAPDATLDDVLPRLVQLATEAEESVPGRPTILMGASAGGALVLAMAERLRDLGGPRPTGVVGLSPWLDATLDEDAVAELEAADPMLAESGLRAAGRWWAGARPPADPLVSPMHSDVSGLPPIDIYIGMRDILRPAVTDFAARAEGADTPLHVHEVSAMFHVWMTRLLPEAARTRRELVQLVRDRAGTRPR